MGEIARGGEICFAVEIPLRGARDGFHFTVSEANDFTQGQRPRISPRRKPRFHKGKDGGRFSVRTCFTRKQDLQN